MSRQRTKSAGKSTVRGVVRRARATKYTGYNRRQNSLGEAMSSILPYAVMPAMYVEYDPGAPAVAARVKAIIEASAPWALVEHIGSTAVPGCAGKGIVDLAAFYPPDTLARTREAIDHL